MTRGEVWWAELPPPIGRRPIVILTRNSVLRTINSIVVCLVTTRIRALPSGLPIGPAEGLPMRSVASLDNLLTVPKARLVRLSGKLSEAQIVRLNSCLKVALEIE